METSTLFDKIWKAHVVKTIEGGPDVLFIDRQYMHEVTSPAAFEGIRRRGIKPLMPERITAVCDHNIPTHNHLRPVQDPLSEAQISALERNTKDFNIPFFGLDHPYNGILHVVGPELGLTQPGMTIVCGDSHTSTHGALGCIAFGIGTSEVETVTATQCLLQYKPKQMNIRIDGSLSKGVTSKDLALYILSQYGTDLGTGYFIEFSGSTISSLSVESRMTLCNMSIEMGARGALIAPDSKTIEYIRHTPYAPKDFNKAITHWQTLFSDPDAIFDKIIEVNASDVSAMITYGTNPGMAMPLDGVIPDNSNDKKFVRALRYMGFAVGEKLIGKPIQNVFIGSCTNGRIEDFRLAAEIMRDKKVADGITVWIVPGSNRVLQQMKAEGLDTVFKNAGAEVRLPGCSACLGMNADRVPSGNYCVSTSNRNFEGRQGAGARTILASPITAAWAAVKGVISLTK